MTRPQFRKRRRLHPDLGHYAHCGRYRIRDTWAQDPETGEQGLESVRYEEADERSLGWIAERSR